MPIHRPSGYGVSAEVLQHASNPKRTTLRWRLKSATQTLHERLDERLSSHDISTLGGFAKYLKMNAVALSKLRPSFGKMPARWSSALVELECSAWDDLRVLNVETCAFPSSPKSSDQPSSHFGHVNGLAIMYVVGGSRLGAKVRAKRKAKSTDRLVRSAASFLKPQPIDQLWPEAMQAMNRVDRSLHDEIIEHAIAIFHEFENALDCRLIVL